MKLVGEITGYDTKEVLFTVNIIDACSTMTLTTTLIAASQQYIVQSGMAVILGDTLWTQSDSVCPDTVFELIDTDTGATADSIFYISGTIIFVDTSDLGKVNQYNLKLEGTVPGYSATNEVLF